LLDQGKIKQLFQNFYNDPFLFIDNLDLKLNLRFHVFNLNPFRDDVDTRKKAFLVSIFFLGAWIFFGFDSTPLQLYHVVMDGLLKGVRDLSSLRVIYQTFYGKEMHYSAFVLYGLTFWYLCRHYNKKMDIKGTQNFAYSAGITFLSIAVFEFFWMTCFSIFQNQPWVTTPRMPQMRIHLQNLAFFVFGCLIVFFMYVDSHKFNNKGTVIGKRYRFKLNKKAVLLMVLTLSSILLWIYYPFPVEHFSVETSTGLWLNSRLFPQTLYTIDVDTTDSLNAGVWFYRENDLIHLVNTGTKALLTLTFLYVFSLEKKL